MNEIKVGDVVCLKSNKSVRMTVRWVEKEHNGEKLEACCDWFIGKELKQAVFPVASLTTDTSTSNFTVV